MLPTFVIIGAQKAGTSSLYQYLTAHPDVFMPQRKEPDYFVAERGWDNGRDWYESLFADAGGAIAVGEASVSYTMFPHYAGVPARMAAVMPDARLVYLLRDPVERARSDYLHYRYPPKAPARKFVTIEQLPIERALLENPLYLDTSRYAMQLEQYLEHFDREQILVVTTDELAADRNATVRKVLAFIGVDPARAPATFDGEYNRTEDLRVPVEAIERLKRLPLVGTVGRLLPRRVRESIGMRTVPTEEGEMSDELRARVTVLLRDDVARLRPLLGDDFDGWGIAT